MRGSYIVIACALGACVGDPAVDVSYEGEALHEMKGLVCAVGRLDSPTTKLGVAWTTLSPSAASSLVTGETQAIDARDLPADFRMPLFVEPPANMSTTMRLGDALVPVDVGLPIMFDDLDGDGIWAGDAEPLLGAARGQVLLHAGTATQVGDSGLALSALSEGYSVANASCANGGLTGFDVIAPDTRIEIWLLEGVIPSPLEELAPETCFWPF